MNSDTFSREQIVPRSLQQMHAYGYNYVKVFTECSNLHRGLCLSPPDVPVVLLRAATYQLEMRQTISLLAILIVYRHDMAPIVNSL